MTKNVKNLQELWLNVSGILLDRLSNCQLSGIFNLIIFKTSIAVFESVTGKDLRNG